MASQPRILTFNFHEPYLCLMAKTGWRLDVGEYAQGVLQRPWHMHYRAIPKNVTLVPEPVWKQDLMAGKYDVAIAQNETNAIDLFRAPCAKLLVCHNRRSFLCTTVQSERGEPVKRYNELLERLEQVFEFVFISESKRADYGIPGRVIRPGIDVEDYGGYTGQAERVLRVGNMMRERDLMFDVDFQERVCDGFPNRVAGDNPDIPGAEPAASFEQLLALYREARCLLHVTREDWEDGYNLAMLEAMACGMPVVSLANRTSPITDGVDGYASYDVETLRAHIRALMQDPALAREIGAKGRQTVAREFPIQAFADKWREAIETAAAGRPRSVPGTRTHSTPLKKPAAPERIPLLLHFLRSPLTTGRYLNAAARKHFDVVAAGLRVPEELLHKWGFEGDPPHYPEQEISVELETSYDTLLAALPEGFKPKLYLWIDSGPKIIAPDIGRLDMPKACYLIDSHIAPKIRHDIATHFDYTFLAQKAQVAPFMKAGLRNVTWIPLACSPELHDVGNLERVYDVAFFGDPSGDHNDRRKKILDELPRRYPNSKIGKAWPEDMARAYAQSKIVVNACVNRDVNMRVFEGMASGALLITDEADGLEDLFEDRTHLVIYRSDSELWDLIDYYLAHDAEREAIAAAGKALVLEQHTYDRRIQEIVGLALFGLGHKPGMQGEARFQPGGYFRFSRPELVPHIPHSAQRVLDVGCAAGDFGAELKRQGLPEVHGVEIDPRACAMARDVLDAAHEGDIETIELSYDDGYFDCIIFADVLEHLVNPALALQRVVRLLSQDGVIVMCIPNARFYEVVEMLINGRWTYQDAGIMDRSHLRFFTAAEMEQLVRDAGLEVADMGALWSLHEHSKPLNADRTLNLQRAVIGPLTPEEHRDFLTHQYIVVAGRPGVDRLAKAREALDRKQFETAYALAIDAYGVDEGERGRIMGTAVARLGRLQDAEEIFLDTLETAPGHPGAQGGLGTLYVAMNRFADALPLLKQALEKAPDNHRVQGALGLAMLMQQQPAEAYPHLTAAMQASFEHKQLTPYAAQAAEQLGRVEELLPLVQRYAAFYPGDAALACQYAALLEHLGRRAEAIEHLETFLTLAPERPAVQELLAKIREGAGGGEA